jgi:hypothetical protein
VELFFTNVFPKTYSELKILPSNYGARWSEKDEIFSWKGDFLRHENGRCHQTLSAKTVLAKIEDSSVGTSVVLTWLGTGFLHLPPESKHLLEWVSFWVIWRHSEKCGDSIEVTFKNWFPAQWTSYLCNQSGYIIIRLFWNDKHMTSRHSRGDWHWYCGQRRPIDVCALCV